MKKRRKLTWHERFLVLKEASRLYAASWVRDIGPDLRSNDYKKDDGTEDKSNGDKGRSTEIEPSTLEDIASLFQLKFFRPNFSKAHIMEHHIEMLLKSFIEGYQEGIQQIMEKKEYSSKAQQEGNTDKNST
ncbi:hypothetical protein ES319_A12G078100v1 [Gossypium barbadense]|uniref:Uncharacterized protein n=2 Tax=Gossypium TaxID=3633 RepID=A0A5J5TAL9_GOSBA|nr:hypothetical protein ES319_A12G078100v1 [Gossypium barbadense]KAB2051795.1 hypothetical protein ES319_A12G078100v1 [Gossypium barbadense]TYG89246.1 hypothetical protein ES288_A12G084400v1 [Gossypium darwinii]